MIRIFDSAQMPRAEILYRGEAGSTQAVEQETLRVPPEEIDAAYNAADP